MSDPYRSAPERPCPGCAAPLVATSAAVFCDRGCGEWVVEPALRTVLAAEAVGAVLSFEGFKDPSAKCPDCTTELDGRIWGEAVFRICRRHGVWLEDWARKRFHKTVGTHTAMLQRVGAAADERARELADQLHSDDPAVRLEIARRIIALEQRVAELEKKP